MGGEALTVTSEQALRLIEEASRRNRVLMVDHTFVYTGAVRKIRELVESDGLGDLFYYDSVRVNLGLFQHDVSVIWTWRCMISRSWTTCSPCIQALCPPQASVTFKERRRMSPI